MKSARSTSTPNPCSAHPSRQHGWAAPLALSTATLAPWLVAASLLGACGETAQSRRTFPVSIEAATEALVTDSGWTVRLTKAEASLASARFFAGKVLLSRRGGWTGQRLAGLLWGTAHAHPGHYQPGAAMGELLAAKQVDLLAGATPWGHATGTTGEYGSLQLTLEAPGLRLAGSATRGDVTVDFETPAVARTLEGVRFEHAMNASDGEVRLRVDLAVILSRVDFSGESGLLREGGAAANGFVRGVMDTSAYSATWRP